MTSKRHRSLYPDADEICAAHFARYRTRFEPKVAGWRPRTLRVETHV